MARRGFGGTALRAALGAVAGGFEGYSKAQELERRKQLEQEELSLRKRGLLAQMGATPIGEALGAVDMAAKVPPPGAASAMPGGPALAAQEPARPMSAVQRVMDEFRGRPQRTITEGGQQYALPRTAEENMALNIALQQAVSQDAKAAEETRFEDQAKVLAPLIGGDMGKARMLVRGTPAGLLGVETATPLERRRTEADIAASNAQADASRAAAQLSRSGGKRTQEQVMDNVASAIARYATTKDEVTGKMPEMDQVKVFGSTIRSLIGVPLPLEEEFPQYKNEIAQARTIGADDEQIRAEIRRRQTGK